VQRRTLHALLETALYQRQLLATAVQLLKPGGFLVFSTCTINPGEVAAWCKGLKVLGLSAVLWAQCQGWLMP